MTFEKLLEEYFFARLLRPATQDCYRTAVEQFTHWRNVLPAEVTPHMMARLSAQRARYQAGELESLHAPSAGAV
ncbi:TPA: hypothetical protein ACV5KB_003139 [Enterobacter ludwigii]